MENEFISGRPLLLLRAGLGDKLRALPFIKDIEHTRHCKAHEHQPGLWYSGFPPLRNGTRCHLTKLGNGGSSTASINDFVGVYFHNGANLSQLRLILQAN